MPPRSKLDFLKFAEDVASGRFTYKQIGQRHGVGQSYVCDIVHGRRCPRIVQLIAELDARLRRHAAQRLVGLADKAVRTIDTAMNGERTNVALSAAREVLHRALDRERPPEPPRGAEGPSLVDLTPETKRRVLEELGGPLPPDAEEGDPCLG
jgi:hypothetical protein